MSKTVLLVFPTMSFGSKKDFALPPLGILYLASYLKENRPDVDVHLMDLETNDWDISTCLDKIIEYDPDLVGITVMTPYLLNVMQMLQGLKEKKSSVKVALGGPHITATRGEVFTLDYTHKPDFLVLGEGEETLIDIVDRLDEDTPVTGTLRLSSTGEIIGEPSSRGFIMDLDQLPIIDFGLIGTSNYSVVQSKDRHSLSLMASRGCPYNCSFCDVSITQGKKLRLRSPDHIIKEIEFNVNKYGITDYYFKDSTFTINKNWVSQLCELILKKNLKITWTCNSRPELLTDDLLSLMKKSGCKLIAFGFESADDDVLRAMNKKNSHDIYAPVIRMCRNHGIMIYGFFLIGNFEETPEKAQKTLDFSINQPISWASFSTVVAYPGTDLYQKALETGVLKNPKWYLESQGESFVSNVVGVGGLEHPDFPIEEQTMFMKLATKKFYFRVSWIFRMLPYFLNPIYIIKIASFALKFMKFTSSTSSKNRQ